MRCWPKWPGSERREARAPARRPLSAGSVVVAFSGGTDSASWRRWRRTTWAATPSCARPPFSASLAADEAVECAALADEWHLDWTGVATDELENPAYVANNADRCAHCKTSLMEALTPLATARGQQWSSASMWTTFATTGPARRPRPATARGSPWSRAGFTKDEVRAASRRLGLRTWDKPAAACLSSRLPYGTPVTIGTLRSVGAAEAALKRLGFAGLRVRHHGDVARLEIDEESFTAVLGRRHEVVEACAPRATFSLPSTSRGSARAASTGRSAPVRPAMKERGHDHRASQAHVPESLVRTPVLARMVREFDVEPNIRRANVEEHSGGSFASWWATPATSRGRGVATHRGDRVDLLGDVLES